MNSTNPDIKKYYYHYAAIFYSRNQDSLEAADKSIQATVGKTDPKHPDLPLLEAAYKEKRAELREAARLEAEKTGAVVVDAL